MQKYTRAQYMNKECTHREYYAQFVTQTTKNLVLQSIGNKEYLKKMLVEDINLNNIPLKKWDNLAEFYKKLFVIDGGWSLSNGVCILKEAARQITEE